MSTEKWTPMDHLINDLCLAAQSEECSREMQGLIEEYIADYLYVADEDKIRERRDQAQKDYLKEHEEGSPFALYSEGYAKALTEVLEELK